MRTRHHVQGPLFAMVLTILIGGALAPSAVGATSAPVDGDDGVLATFEGGTIDLSAGWGEATACWADRSAVRCYRTEREMDAAEVTQAVTALQSAGLRGTTAVHVPSHSIPSPHRRVSCSTTLRLYSSTSYTGSVLAIATRGVVLNLSGYGFDNSTSSYKVGACASTFWENAGGAGSTYPGSTAAGAVSPSMWIGWDNRISSIFIA